MSARSHWLGLLLAVVACSATAEAQVKLADRAYSMTAGPDCVGGRPEGCEVFPVSLQMKGPTPLVLRENHDLSSPIVGKVPPVAQITKIDNVWLHFRTHLGVVAQGVWNLPTGTRVYPSALHEEDAYPFADWDDPDDEYYVVEAVPKPPQHFGYPVSVKDPDALLKVEWKQMQPQETYEHWMQVQLADGSKGWAGPCTYDQGYTCEGTRIAYLRNEDTPESRLGRVHEAEQALIESGEYDPDEYSDGDEYSGLPPPQVQPGDPRMLHVLRAGNIQSATFSPDGRQILTTSRDGVARLWNTADGAQVASITLPGASVLSASFSPDGRHVLTASSDGPATIWTLDGRHVLSLAGHVGGTQSATYSPGGTRILTSGMKDGVPRIWDAANGHELLAITADTAPENLGAYLPEDALVGRASRERYATEFWDAGAANFLQALTIVHLGQRIDFSPDGKRVARMGWEEVIVNDTATGEELFGFSIHTKHVSLMSVAYAPDGATIITGEELGYARVWDATSGDMLFGLNPYDTNSPHWRPGPSKSITDVAISPDGGRILTVGRGAAHIWGVN